MRVVFDTNVLVAALVVEGLCTTLLARARRKHFQLFLCPFILDELQHVLSKKLKTSEKLAREAIDLVLEAAEGVVSPMEGVRGICHDRDDDHVLACALGAKARYLVTGDKDLLELKEFRDIVILSPREFEMLFSEEI